MKLMQGHCFSFLFGCLNISSTAAILNQCVSTKHGYLCGRREKELAAVKINAADVDIIANELEVGFLPSLCPFCHVIIPRHLLDLYCNIANSWTRRWLREPYVNTKVMLLLPFVTCFAR